MQFTLAIIDAKAIVRKVQYETQIDFIPLTWSIDITYNASIFSLWAQASYVQPLEWECSSIQLKPIYKVNVSYFKNSCPCLYFDIQVWTGRLVLMQCIKDCVVYLSNWGQGNSIMFIHIHLPSKLSRFKPSTIPLIQKDEVLPACNQLAPPAPPSSLQKAVPCVFMSIR